MSASTDLTTIIARVRELDAEATAAPWRPEREPQPVRCDWLDRHCGDGSAPIESTGTAFAFGVAVAVTAEKHDAALIAYYRTAAPQLAAECERLRERVRVLEEALRPFQFRDTHFIGCRRAGFGGEPHNDHDWSNGREPATACSTHCWAARAALEGKP